MQINEYELMRKVQGRHWWWRGREKLLLEIMNNFLACGCIDYTIADLGSGFGANISLLSNFGTVYALETDDECLSYIASTEPNAIPIKWKSPEPLDYKFDVILLADVLEHIEDDCAAMMWIFEHLKPGGFVFVTVPAHMYLWSEMDDVVHHYRRYSKKSLLSTVGPKLVIKKISFYNAALYPVKVAFVLLTGLLRLASPDTPKKSYNELPPSIINLIFKIIMTIEAKFIRYFNLPFGVSLVMVVKKV